MRSTFLRLWAFAIGLTTILAGAAMAQTAPRPPRIETSVLAQRPFLDGPGLSPDGKLIAARINFAGKQQLGIVTIDGSVKPKLFTLDSKQDLRWYRWAGNGTLLVSVGTTVDWIDGDAYRTSLLAIDYATSQPRFLGGKDEGLIGDDVLWIDPEGHRILLAFQRTIYEYPSVSSIDIATNRGTMVVPPRLNIWDWYADDSGVVRSGFGFSNSQRWQMVYRSGLNDKFHVVVRAKVDDDDAVYDAVRIASGSDEGYTISSDASSGRFGLYRFNFATRTKGELVYASATNDVESYDLAPDGRTLLAAWYIDDQPRVAWFDASLQGVQAALDKAVGARRAVIVSRSRDMSRMLVHVGNSHDPGRYFLFDQSEGIMHKLAHTNEQLQPGTLAATSYVHYTARDGLVFPAYLTLPIGRSPSRLPLIILPHGGPYDVRDDGTFDAEVQFYANRGYVVLQPEFRGSGGYGKPFYAKGEGQWGRAMQDDLDDGMDWLARQGTIDPKRVCLIGSSYGGYAALWGAVRNPERYRCAASFAGVSDLGKQLKYQLDFRISKRYRNDWRATVQGDPSTELKTLSPLYTIDRLRVPVLLMHGDKDQRVPFKQSKLFADALKQAGRPYEFYPLAGEGHGFSTSANMQQWFDRLDAFLVKYNPAD